MQELEESPRSLYRTGEERVTYNEYMKTFAHKKRYQYPHCEKKTINLDFHTKMHHQEINPPMSLKQNVKVMFRVFHFQGIILIKTA